MRNQKKILLDQMDRKLTKFRGIDKVQFSETGWINSIRISINMTLEQLGKKLNMSKQGVNKLEKSEETGAISIKTLKEVGRVLDMKFVYGFVPIDGSLDKLIDRKAKIVAREIVLRTNQNMKLENQGNKEAIIKKSIEELSNEIKRELNKSLWD